MLTPPPVQAAAAYLAGHDLALEDVAQAVARFARDRGRNPLEELELGVIDEPCFLATIADAIGLAPEQAAALDDFSDHYFEALELNHELLDHLAKLGVAGTRLAILTNNARDWHDRWLGMRELSIFEVFVNSALVGLRKPDPAIYRLAAERIGLPTGRCVFLDDLEVNCAAARSVGMRAIHFTGTPAAIEALDLAVERAAGR